MGLSSVSFVIVIPTLNAAKFLEQADSLRQYAERVLVIDSESNDNTLEVARSFQFSTMTVKRSEFDHGATRQQGVAWAAERGASFVVFLTQDALALQSGAIDALLAGFADESVAAVCGRQLPRAAAGAIEQHARYFNYPTHNQYFSKDDLYVKGIRAGFMSNSFAAYRIKALLERGGFPAHCIFGEDMLVALRLLKGGYKTAYIANAATVHSHGYSLLQEFRRYFDIGVMHVALFTEFADLPSVEGEGLKFVQSECLYLLRHQPWLLPEAMVRTALKYIAYRLGRNFRRLPYSVRVWCSMNRGYWRVSL
jgi:rhamnosyltransferase